MNTLDKYEATERLIEYIRTHSNLTAFEAGILADMFIDDNIVEILDFATGSVDANAAIKLAEQNNYMQTYIARCEKQTYLKTANYKKLATSYNILSHELTENESKYLPEQVEQMKAQADQLYATIEKMADELNINTPVKYHDITLRELIVCVQTQKTDPINEYIIQDTQTNIRNTTFSDEELNKKVHIIRQENNNIYLYLV